MGEVKKHITIVAREMLDDLVAAAEPLFPQCKLRIESCGVIYHDVLIKKHWYSLWRNTRLDVVCGSDSIGITVPTPWLLDAASRVVNKYDGQGYKITVYKLYREPQAIPSAQPAAV